MSLTSTYDNEWVISLSGSNATAQELTSTNGAFVGNGKIGLVAALDRIGAQKCVLGCDFDFDEQGMYKNNLIAAYDFASVKLFDNAATASVASVAFVQQSLNMYTGIATTQFVFTNTASGQVVDVSCDAYPVRHMPYCVMQTLTMTPRQDMSVLDMFHEVSCDPADIAIDDYNNNVIHNEQVNPDFGIYVLSGKGVIKGTGKSVVMASSYVANDRNKFNVVGFNRFARDPGACYQKISLTDLVANTPYTFNILTTQMSEYDFKMPLDEVKRITVNVAYRLQTPEQLAQFRQNHVNAWYAMWKSNMTLYPKAGINAQEAADFNSVKRLMRYSMYNIWSSVREGVRTEVNPSNLTLMDGAGTLFWDGDMWFLPVLVFLRPSIAKNVLEARYRSLDRALQLAAGYGYSGSKYPYTQDVSGYMNAPYWDVNGPMHIFNTALVTLNIWNYYRMTVDKDWLRNKGYAMMRNNADFFVSKATANLDGTYHFEDVYSMNNRVSTDNALTNYLIKAALRYTIEASYELNVVSNDDWGKVFFNTDMMYFEDDAYGVVKNDSAATESDSYNILEMVVPLLSYYSQTYFSSYTSRDHTNIRTNLDFYEGRVNPAFESHPINNIILAWLKGSLTNYDETFPEVFNTAVLKVVQDNLVGPWGNMNSSNSAQGLNDNSLGSMFLLMLLTTMAGAQIHGVVTPTRFYTECLGFSVPSTTSMPKTWKNIKLTGVGAQGDSYNVVNKVYYP
jgi:protein-glucosylgalactosylhydroxylysine glucosidase